MSLVSYVLDYSDLTEQKSFAALRNKPPVMRGFMRSNGKKLWWLLGACHEPKSTASKKMGTSVLQSHGDDFYQESDRI